MSTTALTPTPAPQPKRKSDTAADLARRKEAGRLLWRRLLTVPPSSPKPTTDR